MLHALVGLGHWQIVFLVIYLFWQGAFFTIFPEEVILPTLGILWGQGRIGFWEGLLAAQLGLMGGDLILLTLGRWIGPKILKRKPFSFIAGPDTLASATHQIRKHGPRLIFLTRFTPLLRAPIYFAAGVAKMSPLIFLRSDYFGSWLYIPLLMAIGKRLGDQSSSLDSAFHKIGAVMAVLLFAMLCLAIYRERKKVAASHRASLQKVQTEA